MNTTKNVTRKNRLAKYVSILVVLGLMFSMFSSQNSVAYAEGEGDTPSATYRDEATGFEFDYPATWTTSALVALEGGETQVQFTAPDGATMSLIVHRWNPANDLNAYVAYRTESWLGAGMSVLLQEPMTLAGDRPGGRFVVQTTASEQTFFFFTAFGDSYLELNGLGDPTLLTNIASTVRTIETPVVPDETPAPVPTATEESTQMASLVTPSEGEIIPDQYVVVYKTGVMAASAVAADSSVIESLGGEVNFIYTAALQGYAAYLPAKALEEVRRNPLVDYVAADMRVSIDNENNEIGSKTVQSGATWGLDRIDQRNLPLSSTYTYNTTASNVHVYVIDTGIRSTHTQFGARATKNYDAIGDGQNGNDCNGHGTHVAGTIGGTTYGVAKAVKLHGVRVLDCSGSGSTSGVIAGVNWVTANHIHPAVANMSLGGGYYAPLETAIQSAITHGVTFVVAAGNDDVNACNYSPAHLATAITVGSTTSTDARSYFSNWGSCLDIFAPGSSITSAWYTSDTATNTISGTSMASPHVAGVAALYLATHTAALPAAVSSALISNSTLNKVTDPSGSPNRLLYSLWGAAPSPIPTPLTPSGTVSDTTPTFTWTRVTGATSYQFSVYQGATLKYTKTVASSACGSNATNCVNTPTNVLAQAAHTWKVRAYVGGAWKTFSASKSFTVAASTAFNSQFTSNAAGWTPVNGAWSVASGYYQTPGVANSFASSKHSYTYNKFTYEARLQRTGCASCSYGVIFNGTPAPLGSGARWNKGYGVFINDASQYTIGMYSGGVWSVIQPWTAYSGITSGLNIIKVSYNSTTKSVYIYINGVSMGSGTFASYTSGQVGVTMYNDASAGNRLYVDYAKLGLTAPAALSEDASSDTGTGIFLSDAVLTSATEGSDMMAP
jgi:subtilisin family serine protease